MGNKISTLKNIEPHYKIMMLTPLLYPNDIGFTRWNYCNLLLSHVYGPNKTLTKFNANNSAAVLFGSLVYYILSPTEFHVWLKRVNISHWSEKVGHFLPFIYYLCLGAYNKPHYKTSVLSFIYELSWSASCGKHLLDKSDMYNKPKYNEFWYVIWMNILWGHFFNTRHIPLPQLTLCQ